ncbi:hypothetical protein D3C81_1877310 [compost metagenome]
MANLDPLNFGHFFFRQVKYILSRAIASDGVEAAVGIADDDGRIGYCLLVATDGTLNFLLGKSKRGHHG